MRGAAKARSGHGRLRAVALLGMSLAMSLPGSASAKVRVVATNPTLADLVRQVGGDEVRVESLMRGPENPHNVIPKPSFVMKLRKADLFVHLGLDAEPWVPTLLRGARQERFHSGGAGSVDTSSGIDLLDVPTQSELTRAAGDIHVYGNTHYVLDPMNGIAIGHTIARALTRVEPSQAAMFEERAQQLERSLRALTDELVANMKPFVGSRVVTYHRTWPYFLKRFELTLLNEVEPKPGIAPGPRHIAALAEEMKRSGAGLVLVETFSNLRTAERLAELADGRTVVLAQEVNALPEVESYQQLFRFNIEAILTARRALEGALPSGTSGAGSP